MRPEKLLRRINRGDVANVRFADLVRLVEVCGFELDRVAGSHHVFVHREHDTTINLQEVAGKAKPYQARQVRKVIERYALGPEGRS